MRALSLVRVALVATSLAAFSACSDSTAPTPAIVTTDSLIATMSTISSYGGGPTTLAGGTAATGSPSSASKCTYNASNQRFECAPHTANGLTMTMYFQYLSASGQPLSSFSPSTVDAIRHVSDISGTISPPPGAQGGSITITGHSDQTLSGLLSATQKQTGTSTTTTTFGGITMTSVQTTDLTLPPRGSNGYPTGTIKITMTSTGTGAPSTPIVMTMTFNGTSTVTFTYNGSTCAMNLATPGVASTCTVGP